VSKKPLNYRKPWTPEELQKLREMAKQKVTTGDMAAALQRTIASVEKAITAQGLSYSSGRPPHRPKC